jgi:hypothetical protein
VSGRRRRGIDRVGGGRSRLRPECSRVLRRDQRVRRRRGARVRVADGLAGHGRRAGVDVLERRGARLPSARLESASASRLRQWQPRRRLRRVGRRPLERCGLSGRRGRRWDGNTCWPRLGSASGLRLRLRRGRSERWGGCRQEQQRVDVALWVLHAPHTHVDKRLGEVGLAGRADGADELALDDGRAATHHEGTEMHQCDREPVAGQQRKRSTAVRNRAGECDRRVDWRPDRGARGGANIDAAVLTRSLRIRIGKIEWPEDWPLDRPCPRRCRRRKNKGCERDAEDETKAPAGWLLSILQTATQGTRAASCCQISLQR